MKALAALGSGVAGACALTLLHETARQYVPNAPRMDVLGERAIHQGLQALGRDPLSGDELHQAALAGDLVSNSLFYSLVGLGNPDNAWLLGALLGAAAGFGGVVLPGPMGLGSGPSARTPQTQAMTVAWYTVGGLVAGAVFGLLARDPDSSSRTHGG